MERIEKYLGTMELDWLTWKLQGNSREDWLRCYISGTTWWMETQEERLKKILEPENEKNGITRPLGC